MGERARLVVVSWAIAFCFCGCAIVSRSDKFGADWDIGVGGILSYVADVHFKGSVGFSKTCQCGQKKKKKTAQTEPGKEPEADDEGQDEGAGDPDPLGIDHFL